MVRTPRHPSGGIPLPLALADRPRERRLALTGLSLHSWWSFDVPEVFPDCEQLYVWLSWGYLADEVPGFDDVRPSLDRIFAEHRGPEGIAIRPAGSQRAGGQIRDPRRETIADRCGEARWIIEGPLG